MKTLGLITLVILGVIVESFTFMSMWNWFVFPLGVTKLTMLHAIGLMLMLGLVLGDESKVKNLQDFVNEKILGSILILASGFVISIFM